MTKTKALYVRITPDEQRTYRATARRQETTLSKLVRELLQTEAKRYGLWPPTEGKDNRDD